MAINADGTGQTPLTPGGNLRDFNPVFSPEGTKIAFDRQISADQHIFVANADGTNAAAITSGMGNNIDPSWSPDGQKLVFASNRNGSRKREIFVVNADGSGVVQLTTNVQLGSDGSGPIYSMDSNPSWSPDGSRIAYVSTQNGFNNSEIYLISPDGTNQTRLTNTPAMERYPTWSPDSQRIGFDGGAASGLRVMNRDGSNVVSVNTNAFNAQWAPDGARFAFNRYDPSTDKFQIFTMNVDGSNVVKVTNNPFDSLEPSWAPSSSAPIPTSGISGQVRDGSGLPITGATLTLTGAFGGSAQSDANGHYAFAGLPAGNYRIVIAKSGFGFNPTSIDINNLTTDQTIDFTGYVSFAISGQVSGLVGSLNVTLSGSQDQSVTTDPQGNYSFGIVPAGGNYTVSISSPFWNVSPGSYTFNNLSANQTANFTATRTSYNITGRITRLGNPLPGVTIAVEDGSGSAPLLTSTDANGRYAVLGLRGGGNFIIRPSKANFLFNPQTWDFSALDGNKTADFVALSDNHLLFGVKNVFAGEGECNLVLSVVRGGNATGVGPIAVQYSTADGTATAGSDYVAVSGTLNFPEGTTSRTITIPFLADQNEEGPETFTVSLSNPTGEVDLADPSTVTVVITDPAPPTSLVLATQPNSDRAIAMNTVNLIAEPFKPTTTYNFGPDTKTRVSFFISGVQFPACQGTSSIVYFARDSQQHLEFGQPEGVFKLRGNNPYLQVNVALPQGLLFGDLMVNFTLGNLTSNSARISVQP